LRTYKLIVTVISAAVPTIAFADSHCEDDPRLSSINSYIEEMNTSGVEPIALTPISFLELTPGVRSALGDNLVVMDETCNTFEVFNGQPPAPLEAPFNMLYSTYLEAIYREDEQTIAIIESSFKAASIDPIKMIGLLSPVNVDPEFSSKISDLTGIAGSLVCRDTEERYITGLDIFAHLGGTVKGQYGNARFAIAHEIIHPMDTGGNIHFELKDNCEPYLSALQSGIAKAGGDALIYTTSSNSAHLGWNDTNMEVHRSSHLEWIEAGGSLGQ
jgi:hypothetical protein